MAGTQLYFDPARNRITGTYATTYREITKDEVPALVRAGAEVDKSAREVNATLKQQSQ